MHQIMIIEDNETLREGMAHVLKKLSVKIRSFADPIKACEWFEQNYVDLVITDYRMPGIDGLQVLEKIKSDAPETLVLLITAYGTIDLAVKAMKLGATDFITKPFSNQEFNAKVEKLCQQLDRQKEMNRLLEENVYLRQELEGEFNFGEIIGQTREMKSLFRTITKVARTDSSVLIYGESGTGKELVARAIHKASPRQDKPFIRINCGALAEGVLESELFGHEKGAFTGAIKQRKGRFELADGGTLFLDEIGELPSGLQVKLLRVIQEQDFERVGGEETIRVNVRLITATHRDLEKLVRENSFREDLYYRLHIIPIYVPPLRERADDIPLLSQYFLERMSQRLGLGKIFLSKDALHRLQSYTWPGNVRELENVLERACVLAENRTIHADDLPISVDDQRIPASQNLNDILAFVEKQTIEKAMQKAHGVKTRAARLLGIKTSALYYKLEKYGLIE
jgi:two-component system, NtrC family, response regulator HydG